MFAGAIVETPGTHSFMFFCSDYMPNHFYIIGCKLEYLKTVQIYLPNFNLV